MSKYLLVPIDGSDLTDRDMTAADDDSLLQRFSEMAREAGVPFTGHHAQVPRVDKAIIAAAESRGCDMIETDTP